MQSRINDSNHTLRWNRTSKDALGYSLKSWHFPPENPNIGDHYVAVGCIAIAIILPLAAYLFDLKLGG